MVCVDLLKKIPQADKSGFFEAYGEQWGTIGALIRILKLSTDGVRARIGSFRRQDGKDQRGYPATFYALSDVKKACADLLRKKRRQQKK